MFVLCKRGYGFCNLRIITKAIFNISGFCFDVNRFWVKFLYKINRGKVVEKWKRVVKNGEKCFLLV